MPLHFIAWEKALKGWECGFTEKLFYQWAGTPVVQVIEKLNLIHGLSIPAQQISDLREKHYFEVLSEVRGIPEVVAHVDGAFGKLPLAVVSGSPRDSVCKTLGHLGLLDRFETIVGAEDCVQGKPSPEGFLLAAQRLNVEPSRCLVFEDADFGIQAAESAGMKWVRVPHPWERA